MKVLVTGASGFVGQHLINELNLHKTEVVCLGRNKPLSFHGEFYLIPDFNDTKAWQKALKGCDVIVHLAARVHVMKEQSQDPLEEFRKVNVAFTIELAKQALQAGVNRFIYISSIGVNGDISQLPFTEKDNPKPHNYYAKSKLEAELALLEIFKDKSIQLVIIRPPMVYGASAPGNFASLLSFINKRIPLPLGSIHNKRSFVYVGNLVNLILRCIEHYSAANEIFFVSDGCDLSTTELLKASSKALGIKSILVPVPQKLVEFIVCLLGQSQLAKRLCGNLQVDISKAKALLDWQPPFSVDEGLKKTVDGVNLKVDENEAFF